MLYRGITRKKGKGPFYLARVQRRAWHVRYSFTSDLLRTCYKRGRAGIKDRNILKYKELWAMALPMASL